MENKGAWLLIAGAVILSVVMVREMWAASVALQTGLILYYAVCASAPLLYAFWVWLKFCKVRPEPVESAAV
jgi:hypothetical protein